MVFTSLPLYHLDPPNWNQTNQHQVASNDSSHHLISPQLISSNQSPAQNQAQPTSSGGGGGGGGSSRPGSMTERARMAKIPLPEQALKCPRCDSTNTKFCYFNNYSLTQPRHFCKTCRRYWTRGGALRNVPVGGGCRRNKRSGSGSKSSSHNNKNSSAANNSSAAAANSSSSCSTATNGSAIITSNYGAQLPFLSSLHPLADHYGASLGLNFTPMQQQQHHHHQPIDAGDYQLVGPDTGGSNSASMGLDQWRIQQIQQFPFFGGLDGHATGPVAGIYPNFDGEMSKVISSTTTSGLITQLASVKMEDSHPHQGGMSLPRQYLGMPGNDPYLGGSGGWAGDLSGFNTSSSGNML